MVPLREDLFFSVMRLGGVRVLYFTPEIYAQEQEMNGGTPAHSFLERRNVVEFKARRDSKLSEILGFDVGGTGVCPMLRMQLS